MACECLEKSKENILVRLAEMYPEYKISDSDFQNQIYSLAEEGPGIILTHRFEYNYSFTRVNGEQSKPRTSTISINPTYCGFCGKKFIEDKPSNDNVIPGDAF